MEKKLVMKFGLIPQNMGDMLNVLIPRDLFGYEIEHVNNIYQSESTGIGSYLGDFFIDKKQLGSKKKVKEIAKKIKYYSVKSDSVSFWSTGFMNYPSGQETPIRKEDELLFSSVRGELSKKRIEKILNKNLDITTGDAGLLTNELVPLPKKKYAIGIIPHFREKDESIFQIAQEHYSNSCLIDLGKDPYEVIKNIGECEVIISSSLHGLIVADSFGIPNVRVTKTTKLFGDGFKFDDYYSSFDVPSKKIHLSSKENFPSVNDIYDNYLIDIKKVDQKRIEIKEAFFKNLN